MAIYRKVYNTFWTDQKIVDDFTAEDKLFLLYLMTNPHTNLCGCYEISVKQTSLEISLDREKVEELIDRMDSVHKVAKYNASTKEILVLNWFKYNWTKSADFQKALAKEIDSVKCSEFKEYLVNVLDNMGTVYRRSVDGGETVSGRSVDGGGTTVTVSVTDTVTDTVSDADKKKRAVRHHYGEFNHVLLSDEEFNKLCDEYGEAATLKAIRKVDEYCERSGKTYKNYYLTLRNWGFSADRNEERKSSVERKLDMLANLDLGGGMNE